MTNLLQYIFLVVALSLDTFAACAALGAKKIRLPFYSLAALSVTCSLSLLAACLFGDWIALLIQPDTARAIGCFVLMGMGIIQLFHSMVAQFFNRCCDRETEFRLKNLKIFLRICVDCTRADLNQSQTISVSEAIGLAAALSIDGLAAGFGAGMTEICAGVVFALSILIHLLSGAIGYRVGKKFAQNSRKDFSIGAGAALILLGVFKLIAG